MVCLQQQSGRMYEVLVSKIPDWIKEHVCVFSNWNLNPSQFENLKLPEEDLSEHCIATIFSLVSCINVVILLGAWVHMAPVTTTTDLNIILLLKYEN